ncbi:MAG: nucleotidyl transferase, partial [Halorhabdus sp.]
GTWVDATYPWDLLELAREVLANGRIDPPESRDRVWVDASASVHDAATIQSPAVIGPDCEVGPGAVIGPNVALGRNVTVGANATLARTVVDNDTRVGPGSTLIDTVLGQAVTLGANTVVSDGPGDVRIGTEIVEDAPLGALLADRVQAGGNVSFAPGTLVGPNARLATGVTVDGNVREGAEVRR